MIISASRRTDIPAFYSEWFMNRIRAEFVLVANPFNKHQVKRVPLDAAKVDAIVFWTRNPRPLMCYLDELDARGYRYSFHYTITGYPPVLEQSTPSLEQTLSCFSELSGRLGAERVLWRYDPILLSNAVGFAEHRKCFSAIASALRGKTRRVTVSFAEFYNKTKRNLARVKGLTCQDITRDHARMRELIDSLQLIAQDNGMEIRTCAMERDLGVGKGKCIDESLLKKVFGIDYPQQKDAGQRASCCCVKSIDIGQYNTCLHGCVYCYATYDTRQATKNRQRHDPGSPILIGSAPESAPVPRPRQYTLF